MERLAWPSRPPLPDDRGEMWRWDLDAIAQPRALDATFEGVVRALGVLQHPQSTRTTPEAPGNDATPTATGSRGRSVATSGGPEGLREKRRWGSSARGR